MRRREPGRSAGNCRKADFWFIPQGRDGFQRHGRAGRPIHRSGRARSQPIAVSSVPEGSRSNLQAERMRIAGAASDADRGGCCAFVGATAMIRVSSVVRVWIATGHTDMRRGMNSLACWCRKRAWPTSRRTRVARPAGKREIPLSPIVIAVCLFNNAAERGLRGIAWPQILALPWLRSRRPACCGHLQPDRHRQNEWRRSGGLVRRCPRLA